jgi:tRNA threonylcarbamoyladenosine biosynthesis protein TsaE
MLRTDRRSSSASIRTSSTAETEELGSALAGVAFPNAVLLLEGPLGSGKTALARGVGRGLEVREAITSPSFTILAIHQGTLPLFHLDLYRLSAPSELRSIELDEIVGAGGLTVVEWPRWLLEQPPAGSLEVRITMHGEAENERLFELRALDRRWDERLRTLL